MCVVCVRVCACVCVCACECQCVVSVHNGSDVAMTI